MLDIFNDDAFTSHALTEAINLVPFQPKRIGAMGLFETKNPRTNTVLIERKGDVLTLLETKPRGSGETNKKPATRRDLRPVLIPHIPHDDAVLAADLSGIREFGTEDALEQVTSVVNDKLEGLRRNHEITHEYHRLGAIKGVIVDGDAAASELLDLFDLFDITQEEAYFDLAGTGESLKRTCLDVISFIEDALGGETYDHVHAIVGKDFFADLVTNEEVKTHYDEQSNYRFGVEQQGTGTPGRGTSMVTFGDITFECYRGKVGSRPFVADDKCHLFPMGVPGLFQQHFGPANTISDVNTPGKDIYVQQAPMKWDEGVELHSESNPLMLCKRPRLLVLGHSEAES